jgi:hypothetical protein
MSGDLREHHEACQRRRPGTSSELRIRARGN